MSERNKKPFTHYSFIFFVEKRGESPPLPSPFRDSHTLGQVHFRSLYISKGGAFMKPMDLTPLVGATTRKPEAEDLNCKSSLE